MKRFSIEVTERGLAFLNELCRSKLAVSIDTAEDVVEFKQAVMAAKEITTPNNCGSPSNHDDSHA